MGSVREVLSQYGYVAVFAILFFDSIGVPLPTELSLLVSGYLVHLGDFHFGPTIAVAWAGSLSGSTVSYLLGRRLGPTVMERIARVFRLTPEHLTRANEWFARHGHKAVLFARFIPVVRNYMSYPAGIIGMPFPKFILFTALGYGAWEFANIYAAYHLGRGWKRLLARMDQLAWILAAVAVVAALAWWLWRRVRRGRSEKTPD